MPLLQNVPPTAPKEVGIFLAGLETLTQIPKATVNQKAALMSLEQLLEALLEAIQDNPPTDIEQLLLLIQRPQFKDFDELVKSLASTPFSTITCR